MSDMTVSVVIPSYNRAHYIARTINSVLAQQIAARVEIIVVDDGSTDNTVSLLREAYPEVILISQSNAGPSVARNRGIEAATGEFVAFLDSDDELVAGSLASRMSVLVDHPQVDLVCGDFINCRDDKPCGETNFQRLKIETITRNHALSLTSLVIDNFFDVHLRTPLFLTSALVVRRSAMTQGYLFPSDISIGEDWEFCLRFAKEHKVAIVKQVVVKRHCHGENLAHDSAGKSEMLKVDRRVLSYNGLTDEQRRFAEDRLADDLFEYAYASYWDLIHSHLKGFRSLFESLTMAVTIPKLKLLVLYCLPRWLALRLKSARASVENN